MSHGLSEQELAALSPAERAAVESEYSEDELKTHGADAKPGDKDDDDGDAAVAAAVAAVGTGKPAEPAKVEGAPAAQPAAAADPTKPAASAEGAAVEGAAAEGAGAEPGEKVPFAVPFHHDATLKQEVVKAALDGLKQKYDDGEITLSDFLAKRDEINTAVIKDRVASEISETSKTQMAQALWDRAVEEFLDSNQAYRKDDVLYDALNERVKRLATDEKNANLSDRQLLVKAHEEIKSRFKVGDEVTTKPKDPKAELAARRAPDRTDVPRTLAGVPAASDNQAADDEFSSLERLAGTDPAAYERALAKLSPDQQDRFLRGVSA